jgi:hypothetical protein
MVFNWSFFGREWTSAKDTELKCSTDDGQQAFLPVAKVHIVVVAPCQMPPIHTNAASEAVRLCLAANMERNSLNRVERESFLQLLISKGIKDKDTCCLRPNHNCGHLV